MDLEDFVYIDNLRLDSYAEQVGSTKTYDKVPSYTAGIGLTGLKAEATQSRFGREMTQPEKLRVVQEHLRKQDQIASGRITSRRVLSGHEKVFRIESCRAVQIIVPATTAESLVPEDKGLLYELGLDYRRNPAMAASASRVAKRRRAEELRAKRDSLRDFKGLSIWYSRTVSAEFTDQGFTHELYLLPDLHKSDEPLNCMSAYSSLVALFDEAREAFNKTILHTIPSNAINNPESELQRAFIRDPLEAFRHLGATVTTEREITSLYRLRRVLPKDDDSFITIGYPIFISVGSNIF